MIVVAIVVHKRIDKRVEVFDRVRNGFENFVRVADESERGVRSLERCVAVSVFNVSGKTFSVTIVADSLSGVSGDIVIGCDKRKHVRALFESLYVRGGENFHVAGVNLVFVICGRKSFFGLLNNNRVVHEIIENKFVRLCGGVTIFLHVVISVRQITRDDVAFVNIRGNTLDGAVGNIDFNRYLSHISVLIHLEKRATRERSECDRDERNNRNEFE